jgi:hypothetical protein
MYHIMDVDLLHHIYHFDGIDLPLSQSSGTCWNLCELFISFAKEVVRY